jgi:cytochrome c oxidase subunit 2
MADAMNKNRRKILNGALAAAVGTGLGGGCFLAVSAQPKEVIVKVMAKRFDYTPSHITVKKGVPVVFELQTRDVMMGFSLPDFNVRADIVPDKVTRLRLVPDKTGTFIFLCDIFCGTGHEEMNGKLTVVD